MKDSEFKQLEENLAHHYRMIAHYQGKYLAETGREFCPAGIGAIETPEHRQGCDVYTPDYAPEVGIFYQEDDGYVDVRDITIHGQGLSDVVWGLLDNGKWEVDVEKMLTERAQDVKDDKAVEDWEIRQIEGGA